MLRNQETKRALAGHTYAGYTGIYPTSAAGLLGRVYHLEDMQPSEQVGPPLQQQHAEH